jgi:hypothetical protein
LISFHVQDHPLLLFTEDLYDNFRMYLSMLIFFGILYHGLKVILQQKNSSSSSSSSGSSFSPAANVTSPYQVPPSVFSKVFGFYTIYILLNFPLVLELQSAKGQQLLWSTFNYFDISTVFVLIGLGKRHFFFSLLCLCYLAS